jgi:hypothetical protein
MKILFLSLFFSFLLNSIAFSAEKKKAEEVSTTGRLSLSFDKNSGNENASNFSVGFRLIQTTISWRHTIVGEFEKTKFEGTVQEKEASLAYKVDYYFGKTKKHYVLGFLAYDQNRHYIDFKDSGIFISSQGLNFNLKLCNPQAISMT